MSFSGLLHPRQTRAVAVGSERHGEQVPRLHHVLEHDASAGLDLANNAFVRVIRTVRPVHHEDPPAARSELEALEGVREVCGTPPPRHAIHIGERGEDLSGVAGRSRSVASAARLLASAIEEPFPRFGVWWPVTLAHRPASPTFV